MRTLNVINKIKRRLPVSLSALFIVMSLTGAFAQDIKTEQKASSEQPGSIKKGVIPIEGMMCMSCVSTVKRKLTSLDGVDSIKISLEGKNASFTYDNRKIDIEKIRQAINDLGYKAGNPKIKNK